MRASSLRDFSVYEFTEDDEVVESASSKFTAKFLMSRSTTSEKSPITKIQFLQACVILSFDLPEFPSVVQGDDVHQKELSKVLCVDVDGSNDSHKCNNFVQYPMKASERDLAFREGTSGSDKIIDPTSDKDHGHISQDNFLPGYLNSGCSRADSISMRGSSPGVHSKANENLNFTIVDLQTEGNKVDVISDDEQSSGPSCASPSDSDHEENEGTMEYSAADFCSGHFVETETNGEVSLVADYVTYGDRTFIQPQLTFFSNCIKLEGSTPDGSNTFFSFEWALDDVVHIGCHWSESSEMASVKILLTSVAAVGAGDGHSTSGIMKLAFAVCEPQWFEKERRITMLSARYKFIWNASNPNLVKEIDDFMGQNSMFNFQHCCTDFDEPIEEVVYPKGDPDAVSISKRDVKLLEPETFINDTIIDFYIKYLKDTIHPKQKHRFHFFNSFFFRKLADLDKDPGSALEGRAAFLRVRKWTRKVNIFEKDYIFIPVNYNLHWSLIVICHPGEVAHFENGEIDSTKVPCILHMDSIKGSHRGLKNLVQSYLWEEWKERHGESSENSSLKFSNLRFVPLELPQQENSFDCGLFLLHYVELFLEEAPTNFSPFKITKFSYFLNGDWFPPAEASLKRSAIRKLMCEILEDHSSKSSPSKHISSKLVDNDFKKEVAVENLTEQCSPSKKASHDLLCSAHASGESKRSAPSSPCVVLCDDKEPGAILQEYVEHDTLTKSGSDDYRSFSPLPSYQKFNSVMTPIEEEGETSEQLLYSTPNKADNQLPVGTSITSKTSYVSTGIGAIKMPLLQQTPLKPMDHEERGSCGPSSCENPISSKDRVDEHAKPPQINMDPNKDKKEELRLVSPETHGIVTVNPDLLSNKRLEDCNVADSQESDSSDGEAVTRCKEVRDYLVCQEDFESPRQAIVSIEDSDLVVDVEQLHIYDSTTQDGTHKRKKIMLCEGARRRTRRSGRDWNS